MVRVHSGCPPAVEGLEDPLPVVLFSSQHAPEAFVQLVSELDIRNVEFELVQGVETDSRPALAVMQRHRDRALYVFCMDEVLDRDCAEHLEATFLLSGLIRGRSLMSLSIDEYPLDSLADMLATRSRRLAQQEPLSRALPPPASVETLPGPAAPETTVRSPFEVADGPLERPPVRWPLSRRASLTGAGLALATLVAVSASGSDSEQDPSERATPAHISAQARSKDEVSGSAPSTAGSQDLFAEVMAEHQAIRDRRIRALDLLLIEPSPSPRGSLSDARAYCEALDVSPFRGWRLPTVAEISAVGQARLVPPAYYWTETLRDAASAKQVVYDSRRARMLGRTPAWKGGRGVCVRKRLTPE